MKGKRFFIPSKLTENENELYKALNLEIDSSIFLIKNLRD